MQDSEEEVIDDVGASEFADEPVFIEPVEVEEQDVVTISAAIPEILEDKDED